MDKSPDAFRTISEVAEALQVPAHVLRFWETRFAQIKPVKRAGGRRYYRPADVALLTGIKHLLHDQGMTIRGVQKILREQGVRHVAGTITDSDEDETEMHDSLYQGTLSAGAGSDFDDDDSGAAEALDALAGQRAAQTSAPLRSAPSAAPDDIALRAAISAAIGSVQAAQGGPVRLTFDAPPHFPPPAPLGGAAPLAPREAPKAEPAASALPAPLDDAQDRADQIADEAPFIEAEEEDSDRGQIIAFPGEADPHGQGGAFALSERPGEESPVLAEAYESDLPEDFGAPPQDEADMPPLAARLRTLPAGRLGGKRAEIAAIAFKMKALAARMKAELASHAEKF